jgi:amidase
MDLAPGAPAVDLAAAIRAGRLRSRELLDCYLDRIERLDGPVNSVVTLDAERARAQAERADAERARGELRGPLHGLPVTIKDAIETAGVRSTGGATELAAHVPARDATAVARLRAAGAIVFGKTNLPAWSGDMQTYNELFGTTSNPWTPQYSPGGSSGGAATAVACGFTSFELGTDIGGSIRIPAHLCGTFGLRPSHGLLPQDGYLAGLRRGLAPLDVNVVGPITRSAADLDLLLDVLAEPDAGDAAAWTLRLPPARARPRIGLWLDDPFCPVDTGYLELLRTLADRLADAGLPVADAHPPVSFAESFDTYWTLLHAANGLNYPDGPLTHAAWLAAHEDRLRQRAGWHEWFAGFDALLCPVLAVTGVPHDHTGSYATREVLVNGQPRTHVDVARWTGLVGALGLPVAVAPAGRTADGRPVGAQVITARWHDRTAIRVAALVAEASGGYQTPPGFD